ncbi:MAG: radical SAM protein, partial [Proteobacteria bacterium]|nr:radical SAM protein [Pseudomonadota bacterium]MBU1582677.1 radical SAM protein [Pseudomonadota bacterium]
AAYIATALAENGHDLHFLDLMFCNQLEKTVRHNIQEFQPEVVLFSIRNISNGVLVAPLFYVPEIKEMINLTRKETTAKIIIGGAGFTNYPREMFQYVKPDFGIAGEGEHSIIQLLQAEDPEKIPGLVYEKADGEIICNVFARTEQLEGSQLKALSYINIKKYLQNGSYVGVQTRRGCPRNCLYCSDNFITGRKIRFRDPQKVVEDIRKIKEKYNVKYFFFVDELFSSPNQYAKELLQTIIDSKINIKFEVEDSPPLMDEEYITLLKKAGCLGILLSADSGSDKILKNMKKGFRKKDIQHTCEFLFKNKVSYYIVSLLGGPGETIETVTETFNFFKELPGLSALIVNYGLRIEKGSGLEIFTKDKGLVQKDDGLLDMKFFLSKGFDEEVFNYIYSECSKNPGWMTLSKVDQVIIEKIFKHMQRITPKPEWKQAKRISYVLRPIRKVLSHFIKDFSFSDIQKNPDVIFD